MRLYWPKTEAPSILPPGEGTWKLSASRDLTSERTGCRQNNPRAASRASGVQTARSSDSLGRCVCDAGCRRFRCSRRLSVWRWLWLAESSYRSIRFQRGDEAFSRGIVIGVLPSSTGYAAPPPSDSAHQEQPRRNHLIRAPSSNGTKSCAKRRDGESRLSAD
jgi:hypothetical protein